MPLKADWINSEKEEECSVCNEKANKFVLIHDYAINLEYRACSENCAIKKLVLSNPTLEIMYEGKWMDPYETEQSN